MAEQFRKKFPLGAEIIQLEMDITIKKNIDHYNTQQIQRILNQIYCLEKFAIDKITVVSPRLFRFVISTIIEKKDVEKFREFINKFFRPEIEKPLILV